MSDEIERAFREGYALYMQRVDYRDRLRQGDPERRYAQACVEAGFEMYQLFSRVLRPTEAANGTQPIDNKQDAGEGDTK